jgi:hypothetical protein
MSFLALTGIQIGQLLEGTTIACFGVSWPFAILRTWKAKRVEGKSLLFLVLVFIGYLIGVASKFAKASAGEKLEWIVVFYAINAVLVGTDMCLYFHYRAKNAVEAPAVPGTPIQPPVE